MDDVPLTTLSRIARLKCRKQSDGVAHRASAGADAPWWAHYLLDLADPGTASSVGVHAGPGLRPFDLGLELKREVLTEQPSPNRR